MLNNVSLGLYTIDWRFLYGVLGAIRGYKSEESTLWVWAGETNSATKYYIVTDLHSNKRTHYHHHHHHHGKPYSAVV
jgi:hypothetical protein